jgi:activator of 2-hydroxyglutaryl-CoA dehydratase
MLKALENSIKCKIIVTDSAQENAPNGAAVLAANH